MRSASTRCSVRLTRRRNRVFACAAFACLVGAGFHALFDFSLQMPATAALFAVLLALGWSQSSSARKATPRNAAS
jgi:hypothetical protein